MSAMGDLILFCEGTHPAYRQRLLVAMIAGTRGWSSGGLPAGCYWVTPGASTVALLKRAATVSAASLLLDS